MVESTFNSIEIESSSTGPGFVSMSPHIQSNNRRTSDKDDASDR